MKKVLFIGLLSLPAAAMAQELITQQPENVKTCPGKDINFSVQTNVANASYKWMIKVNGATKYDTIPLGGNFHDITTRTLHISNVTQDQNGAAFQCSVSYTKFNKKKKINENAVVTSSTAVLKIDPPLKITAQPTDRHATIGRKAIFSVKAENATHYKWQVNKSDKFVDLDDDATYSNVDKDTLIITKVTADISGSKYRCVVSGHCDTTTSSVATLRTGIVIKKNLGTAGELSVSSHADSQFHVEAIGSCQPRFQWQISKGNSGFINIEEYGSMFSEMSSMNDDGSTRSTLFIRNVDCNLRYTHARCIVYNGCDTAVISDTLRIKLNGCIGTQRFSIIAAQMFAPDINAASTNLTQTYLRFSIPTRKTDGIPYNAPARRRAIMLRNIFIQTSYTSNADNVRYFDSSVSSSSGSLFKNRYVNRLDLLQESRFNLNINFPLLAYFIPARKNFANLAHFYVQPFISLFNTTVADTTNTVNTNVNSVAYGLNLTYRTQGLSYEEFPLYFEFAYRIFYINPISSPVQPLLNYQTGNVAASYFTPGVVPEKPLYTQQVVPYHNFDALIMYYVNKKANEGASSKIFVHYSLFGNIPLKGSEVAKNSFSLLQLGYSVDLAAFVNNITGDKK
ncbi:MAG: hypothetical protein IAE95_13655 [Chitinophagaceae bacterium]|nr:hypothetical protein [Chitinophagaceae bacterium]